MVPIVGTIRIVPARAGLSPRPSWNHSGMMKPLAAATVRRIVPVSSEWRNEPMRSKDRSSTGAVCLRAWRMNSQVSTAPPPSSAGASHPARGLATLSRPNIMQKIAGPIRAMPL